MNARPANGAEAGAGIEAQETAGIKVEEKLLLLLVEAPTSSLSPTSRELRFGI